MLMNLATLLITTMATLFTFTRCKVTLFSILCKNLIKNKKIRYILNHSLFNHIYFSMENIFHCSPMNLT